MVISNSYKDKYMGVDNRLSVMEILQKVGTTEYRRGVVKKYEAVDIHEVIISGNRFRNYGQYSFIWEKTYPKSPERSMGGSMGSLNSLATFLTPHLILDFSIMSIDDYRKIMLLHYGANEFTVECYDPIYNRKIKVKMYFATEEMAKLFTIAQNRLLPDGQWEEWVDLVGVTEYKVELIGTNNDLDLVTVRYNYNAPLDESGNPIYPNGVPVTPEAEEDVYIGEEIVIGTNSTFPNTPPSPNFVFSHWIDSTGLVYDNGVVITANSNIDLYAVWRESNLHTLSFNYGLSKPMTHIDETGSVVEVYDREVQYGKSIGVLPNLSTPTVEIDKVIYYPYHSGGWYKTPIADSSMKVNNNDLYWMQRDTIIYALWEKRSYSVTYFPQLNIGYDIPTQYIQYGENIILPNLGFLGYTFKGWYLEADYKTAVSGTMPPYDLVLFAKWEAIT